MSLARGFDEIIHAPLRLRICALLAAVDSAEFATIRDTLDVADSVTSKHLKVLSDAGYVALSKTRNTAGRPITWATLTKTGRAAYRGHVAALRELVAEADSR